MNINLTGWQTVIVACAVVAAVCLLAVYNTISGSDALTVIAAIVGATIHAAGVTSGSNAATPAPAPSPVPTLARITKPQ